MADLISVEQLRAFAPSCDASSWTPALNAALARFQIDTPLRIAHFMAQTGEETGGYTVFQENLDYSAAALMRVWPTHFPTLEIAR